MPMREKFELCSLFMYVLYSCISTLAFAIYFFNGVFSDGYSDVILTIIAIASINFFVYLIWIMRSGILNGFRQCKFTGVFVGIIFSGICGYMMFECCKILYIKMGLIESNGITFFQMILGLIGVVVIMLFMQYLIKIRRKGFKIDWTCHDEVIQIK